MLAVLLVHLGESVSRTHLIDQLWGDEPPATAVAALQVHASTLRRALGDRLVTTGSGYRLDALPAEVDARRFETMLAAARGKLARRPADAAVDLAAALALWRGDAYADVEAGTDVTADRTRLAELRIGAVEDRTDAELRTGSHAQVVAELAGLVLAHPTRERLAALNMLALYRCGRVGDARDSFRQLRRRLGDELAVEPTAELVALAAAIDRRDPTLEAPSAVGRPASRFIGRRGELDALAGELGTARLLTITGPGGVGKTRLALELARDNAADYPAGIHVVELATASPGTSIAERVAAAVGAHARPGQSVSRTIATRLGGGRALVVLDNCEHLADACARFAAQLLADGTGIRILATSREPLGVAGERVWPLAGLSVPAGTDAFADAARREAVRLLSDRGDAARPGFRITPENIAVAAHLCQRLDGLPLAIELAAANLRTLSLPEVASRLGRRLDLADERARTAPDRHRTMRTAIDWSYHLLTAEEQRAFRRLAVFAGGCTHEAAVRVLDGDDGVIARLVDRSLLAADIGADHTRYRMLELVREYAADRLAAAAEAAEPRDRHAAWCTELAAATEASLLSRVAAEEANIRAALDWCLGGGDDPARALRIASPLWWYWWARGQMAEGRDWLRRALAATDPAPSLLRGSGLRAAAVLTRYGGDYTTARRLGEQCLSVYESLADTPGTISALTGLCVTALAQRDFDTALRYGQRGRDLATEHHDEPKLASALNNTGLILRCLDRFDEARTTLTAAVRHWRAVNDRRGEAASLGNLGILARRVGDLSTARQLCLASLALYRDLQLASGMLDMFDAIACLEVAEHRPAPGLRLLAVAEHGRQQLAVALLIHDEMADRAAARTAARAALGSRAEPIIDTARTLSVNAVADELMTTG